MASSCSIELSRAEQGPSRSGLSQAGFCNVVQITELTLEMGTVRIRIDTGALTKNCTCSAIKAADWQVDSCKDQGHPRVKSRLKAWQRKGPRQNNDMPVKTKQYCKKNGAINAVSNLDF